MLEARPIGQALYARVIAVLIPYSMRACETEQRSSRAMHWMPTDLEISRLLISSKNHLKSWHKYVKKEVGSAASYQAKSKIVRPYAKCICAVMELGRVHTRAGRWVAISETVGWVG
jgi:hypothetical protein